MATISEVDAKRALAFLPSLDGSEDRIVLNRNDNLVTVWDYRRKVDVAMLTGHAGLTDDFVSVTDTALAVTDTNGTICVWDMQSFQLL